MGGKFLLSYKDYGVPGEIGSVAYNTVEITDVNIVAQTAALDTLRLAMEAISLGGVQKRQLVAWVNETKVEPTDPFAQREIKWLVRYKDTSSDKEYSLEIPCADLQFLDPENSDKALMSGTEVAAYKAAFEAVVRSPEGNATEVIELLFVGRRS